MCYLDIVLQLLPPLLQRFGPQVGIPFARKIWSLDDLPELEVKHTFNINRQVLFSKYILPWSSSLGALYSKSKVNKQIKSKYRDTMLPYETSKTSMLT